MVEEVMSLINMCRKIEIPWVPYIPTDPCTILIHLLKHQLGCSQSLDPSRTVNYPAYCKENSV